MTSEEINKKASEAYPIIQREVGKGKYVPIDNYKKERSGYVKALEEISSYPTIKGWVVRDEYGLMFYRNEPYRVIGVSTSHWTDKNGPNSEWILDNSLFPNLKWEDEPIEVELPIIRK